MKITVKSYLSLRQMMGNQAEFEMEINDITIDEPLDQLCDRFGEGLVAQVFDRDTNEVSHYLRVLVNGRHYTTLPVKLDTRLHQNNDEIALFPPVVGG